MRLVKARIQNYRSIRDTGWFDDLRKNRVFVFGNGL